ncbi:pyrroloquinoline quinone biosynthesis peptide chaperone PqqD [Hydrocarboniclastica marina]|uniref:PqqA binding protein n=1 Tax=Hydrocarboniclastica marina TaxID=2259620 RepID=A0A4P7XD54_9ALTE|nr:pyrroloquinoline quinone biosynthesis peptide chaperone PqqD [Hydrocarboniclastica marina]MAL97956.1 pyrroloquinoline quinone biosynthesis peptide chaperone PqqD [Alteromonadaceae bacterium]QCF24525.1 pyrroloquinoline quinone biosynthesis peptide chaperone PqqD [Hydrocarboniclastica marina]|tara:strand:- start:607 stop:882 length:276 start_codon:yes stop_codon:yes gene_type:complete
MKPTPDTVPGIRPGFRLQFEPAQGCRVLLYPEGMVKLNDSAGEILALVDGERTVADLVTRLSERFPDVPGIEEDIIEFLENAHGEHWIEYR